MTDKMQVYEKLAEMYEKEDIVGGPNTPSFLKVLTLQFTPAEAELALIIRFEGMKLDEIAEKKGAEKENLRRMLLRMADKGTMFYDSSDDPVYKTVGTAAPGLIETGLWCNIKFPFSVELVKTMNTFLKEWSEQTLCELGAPFAPVWGGLNALPEDAKPEENIAEVIKNEGHWSVSPCPCRLSHWTVDPGNHCEHILETCLHTGEVSKWAVKHGMARELSFDEVVQFLKDCNEDGLVHTLNIQNCICNCCDDCCAIFHGQKQGKQVFIPSPFVAEVDYYECNSCGMCAMRCPVDAVERGKRSSVNPDVCLGCGVCVPSCRTGAMKLIRRG
jgi:Pyruvate/2-oxoacid:ferredoxin oxidoreductase delta subunit